MTFQEYLEDLGYNTRSYSGRGMYGRSCLAITVDDKPLRVAWDIARSAVNDDSETFPYEIQSDQMGLSYILYWPTIEYRESDEASEEESQVTA